jgi:7-cyano-7-deazaguanine synthase
MTDRPLAVALLSGGLDSATLAYHLRHDGYALVLLSVDYGQRHARELLAANDIARAVGAERVVLDLAGLRPLLGGSALTDADVAVPYGHYTDASMRATVVPNRNAILLACAYGLAVSRGAQAVAIAVHAGDHAIYPDCRPAFVEAFEVMEAEATEGFARPDLHLLAPFLGWSKADIVARAAALGVPLDRTWSCYEGGEVHCGRCGTCYERREAFATAGVPDPTVYAASPAQAPA